MRLTRIEEVQSEIDTVEKFLSALPESAVMERISWEGRLAGLREQFETLRKTPEAYPLTLTFRGAPVDGSHSIDATFASKALKAFVDATSTVTASLAKDGLRNLGRLPANADRSLRIVDTAAGSFGFGLELPPPSSEVPQLIEWQQEHNDPHVSGITTTLDLLAQAATVDDETLSDLIADIHPRAAAKVAAFAKVLADNDALVSVAFRKHVLRLEHKDAVQRVVTALAETDISERNESIEGTLLGVLPESRLFEARLHHGELVKGKVDRSVDDISELKEQWENKPAQLRLSIVQVRTQQRFRLVGIEEVGGEGEPVEEGDET